MLPSLSLLLASADVCMGTTLFFAGLLVGLILCLALEEKLHAKKSLIAGAFAFVGLVLGVALGLLPGTATIQAGHAEFTLPIYIPSINWEVIAIILGSSVFVDVTSRSGICLIVLPLVHTNWTP